MEYKDLKVEDVIFVPSVQHTGTWFVLKFLERFGYKPAPAINFFNGAIARIEERSALQVHLPVANHLDMVVHPDPFEVRNGDVASPLSLNSIIVLSKIFKTFMPVRDPLAAILTREARHPELRHFYIVDGFIHMAKYLSGNSNVMFLPIDLMDKPSQRQELLIRILKHCGVHINKEVHNIVNEVAAVWEPVNDTPNNKFREAYKEGNKGKIMFDIGAKTAEVEYLKNSASIILPFMKSLGYTKADLDLW
jgi:hypothetical protein|tara:strand:+ start:129 stop:875 length:747 start_codon:yes stop_codon:yes gene_type:complete